MADTSWRLWTTALEWAPDAAPAVRARLSPFLDCVLPKVSQLGVCLVGADAAEVVAALTSYVERTDLAPSVAEALIAVAEYLRPVADPARIATWITMTTDTLEAEASTIQFVVAVLLLERVVRAVADSRPTGLEVEVLLAAATALEEAVRQVMVDVLNDRVPANTYRTM